MFVPVVDCNQQPLMPTTPARARRWIKGGKATAFWKGGIFCVQLNREPSAREVQPVACGIDSGSKKEGLVVASASHTYLNLQADAVSWVKDAEAQSTRMRRTRRNRKTPCRKPRANRRQSKKKLPPSTKALREQLGLKETRQKMAEVWEAQALRGDAFHGNQARHAGSAPQVGPGRRWVGRWRVGSACTIRGPASV